MTHTLLIWELVPEDTHFYLIPNEEVDKDNRLSLMKQAHYHYINQSERNDGLDFLNAALTPEEHINNDDYFDDGTTFMQDPNVSKRSLVKVKTHEPAPKEWRCIFAKYKISEDDMANPIENAHITRAFLSGFIL